MQFYLIPAAKPFLVGTQADGVAACKPLGIKFDPEAMAHDVPTSKAELMAYVNDLRAGAPTPDKYAWDKGPVEVDFANVQSPGQAASLARLQQSLERPKGGKIAPLHCASCARSPDQILTAAAHAIEQAEGYKLGELAWAVAERFAEMGGKRG